MTDPNSFFDDSVRSSAPSLKVADVNDGAVGTIIDQFMLPAKDFSTKEVKRDRNGNEINQLAVVIETALRNWDRVAKIPKIDPTNPNSPDKPASDDDGKRVVYVEPWTNLHAAVGRATALTNGGRPCGLRNGGKFGVKIDRKEDTGKGNPKNVWSAFYEPPAAGAEFFGQAEQAAPAPQPPQQPVAPAPQAAPAPAAPVAQPAAPVAQPAPVAPAPAQVDPWTGQAPAAAAAGQEPPF